MIFQGMRFDVSVVSENDYRRGYRLFRLIGVAGSGVLGVGLVVTLLDLTIRGQIGGLPLAQVVEFGMIGAGELVLLLFAVTNAPMAASIDVGAGGVRMIYPGGRTKAFAWNNPRIALTLYEFPETLTDGRKFPFSRYGISTFRPQSNSITPDAFQAVLESARGAGLEVVRSKPLFGTPRVFYQIRGRLTC